MSQSIEIKDLAAALVRVQATVVGALKDSNNPFFKSKYADLESCWSAIRGPLTENNLSVIQTTDLRDGVSGLVTTLAHASGQWVQGFYPLNAVKADPQSVGAAMTYARRYALAAIVGLIQVDDDGESAMGRGSNQKEIKPGRPSSGDGNAAPRPGICLYSDAASRTVPELERTKGRAWLEDKAATWAELNNDRARGDAAMFREYLSLTSPGEFDQEPSDSEEPGGLKVPVCQCGAVYVKSKTKPVYYCSNFKGPGTHDKSVPEKEVEG